MTDYRSYKHHLSNSFSGFNFTTARILCITVIINHAFIIGFNLQVVPWPLMSTEEASAEIRRLLEDPFAKLVARADFQQPIQLAIAVLKSLQLPEVVISKKERIEVKKKNWR